MACIVPFHLVSNYTAWLKLKILSNFWNSFNLCFIVCVFERFSSYWSSFFYLNAIIFQIFLDPEKTVVRQLPPSKCTSALFISFCFSISSEALSLISLYHFELPFSSSCLLARHFLFASLSRLKLSFCTLWFTPFLHLFLSLAQFFARPSRGSSITGWSSTTQTLQNWKSISHGMSNRKTSRFEP